MDYASEKKMKIGQYLTKILIKVWWHVFELTV